MSLIVLLNPKQYGGAVTPDTSDILDVYRKKKRRSDELEEAIAAQMLQARQKPITLAPKTDVQKLRDILKARMFSEPKVGEVTGDERKKRIRYLLLMLAIDD
jgi:hypothetical protein